MKILAIESSSLVASAAILKDDSIIADYNVDYKKTHSQTLLPMIDEVVKMTDTDLDEMDAVAVSAGPGSFTGLRIGGTTAKGLALALDKPIIAVPTLDAMAYNLCAYKGLICPIMDAKRDEVYTGLYSFEDGKLRAHIPGCALPVSELLNTLKDKYITGEPIMFLGDGVPVFKTQIQAELGEYASFAPAHLSRQKASSVAVLASEMFEKGEYMLSDDFVPEYLRQSQAEREYVEVKKAEAAEGAFIANLEAKTFSDGWSRESVEKFVDSACYGALVAYHKGEACGYVIYQKVAGEGEVLRIAVDENYRRVGIGRRLLVVLMEDPSIDFWSLEVRSGNEAAIKLYETAGFKSVRVRQDYYNDPVEDAVIMEKRIRESL